MKVIGESNEGYICIIQHTELEKFMDQYYGKMKKLKCGDNVDLGRGHDFANEIQDAFKKTSELINSNKRVIEAIFNGITVVTNTSELEVK
jgi:hypothetical protein